jgi:hypothetical protein
MEEVCAFGWEEAIEQVADAVDERIDGSGRFLAQQRLELGERHLDRVHVGTVGRQVEDLGATLGDCLANTCNLVRGQIVEDHDVAAPERGSEDVLDVGSECIAIHRSVEHPRRGHAGQAQPGDKGHGLPVPERRAVPATFSDWRPAIEARHLRVDPGLVEEDEALRIDERLRCSPQFAPRGDVRPVLLGRAQCFF